MLVSFDSFERFETPRFLLCNPGSKQNEDGTISKALGYLPATSDEEMILNFNTTSELNFRAYYTSDDGTYPLVQNRRLIFVDNIGYFVITDVRESTSAEGRYKDVSAASCDIELENKKIPLIGEQSSNPDEYITNNTYRFDTLLEKVIGVCPMWSIGHIDDTLKSKHRTFEDVDTDANVYAFLLEDMQEAFECIIDFNTISRTVSAYSQDNFVVQTDIHLTKDDFISKLDVSENSEDIYTALTVFGDDELSIQLVNPTGGNTIYDFSYYLDWMSDELRAKVVEWQSSVKEQLDPDYDGINIYKLRRGYTAADGTRVKGYFELQQELADLQAERDRFYSLYYYYEQLRSNIIASCSEEDIAEYKTQISKLGGEFDDDIDEFKQNVSKYIKEYKSKYDKAVEDIEGLNSSDGALAKNKSEISKIIEKHKLTNAEFFSAEMQEELSFYIYEGTYTDSYIAVTEDMPWHDAEGVEVDRLTQIATLYGRAVKQLERISKPKCEYNAEVENFVFQKEFAGWGKQLNAGSLINIELEDGDVAALFLSTVTVNYHDKSLKLTFGNRFDRLDPKALYENVLGNIHRTTNSLNYVKDILYPIKSGEFNAFREALASSRNLAKDAAINATNQQIVIDDTGLLGRKINPNTQEFDDRQIKLTNKSLVFTDDNWETCKTALGEIPLPGSSDETAYGLNAELIVGDLMMTSNLGIVDSNNNPVISVDEDGIRGNFINYVKCEGDEGDKQNIRKVLVALDAEGFEYTVYKDYIKVGKLDDNSEDVGIKILHNGKEDGSFYSQFKADELAFYSRDDTETSYSKNTWITNDALNVRRARVFNDILLGCDEEANKVDPEYGKWAIRVDESGGLGIYWNG